MPEDKLSENRRHDNRYPCEVPFPASFRSHAGIMSAFVDDVSSGGAKLRIKQAYDHIPFLVQGEFEYTFHTNLGTTQCRGKTAWVQRVGSDFIWGIEFIKIGDSNNDPLNVIIQSIQTQVM